MNDLSVRSIVLVAAFTALIIVGAIFSFPAPWNPVVPFTLATMFVILSGMILGPWLGMATTALYVLLGTIGLPVFAGGSAGLQVLLGPTGGFLIGYILAAALAGLVVRKAGTSIPALIIAVLIGTLAVYLPGLPWMHYKLLGIVEDWSWAATWGKYTAPFLLGDGVKAIAAVFIVRYLKDRIVPSGKDR